jgi:hypothetical protein
MEVKVKSAVPLQMCKILLFCGEGAEHCDYSARGVLLVSEDATARQVFCGVELVKIALCIRSTLLHTSKSGVNIKDWHYSLLWLLASLRRCPVASSQSLYRGE